MLKKILKLFFVTLLLFLLTGCFQQQQLQEDTLRKNIAELLSKYQQGVNTLDNTLMSEIISDKFSFYSIDKKDYLKQLFTMTLFIDDIKFSNVRVENYKIFSDIEIVGSLVFKPTPNLPLFKDQIPFLNGKVNIKSVFAFAYEKTGLKILAEDPVLTTKEFRWGEALPDISQLTISTFRAAPGDELEINFNIDKGAGNDVVFALVNDYLIGGYSLSGFTAGDQAYYTAKVPLSYTKGQNFEINVMAFAGKVNLSNPQDAKLQGIMIKSYSIPVR